MAAQATSYLELHLEAEGLKGKDLLSKSDPLCQVQLSGPSGRLTEIGRTEALKNTHTPKWSKSIRLPYSFGQNSFLRFHVYDVDNDTVSLDDDDHLGFVDIFVGDIVAAPGMTTCKQLMNRSKEKNRGRLTIVAVEVAENNMVCRFEGVVGKGLDKKDHALLGGKSDPFLVFYKTQGADSSRWVKVHKTPYLKNTLNPKFPRFDIRLSDLCNGDDKAPILIECYDYDSLNKSDLIGRCQVTVERIAKEGKNGFPLLNPKKMSRKNYFNSGILYFNDFKMYKEPSFIEYINGGCEISLMVAVDFTGSNGNPKFSSSLHHVSPHSDNEYMSAMRAVGSILAHYDSDGKFPAWGFGAKYGGRVSHCFPLNNSPYNPEVHGVDGLLQNYKQAISNVQLYGPTNLAEILTAAASKAEQARVTQQNQKYFVLLIMTDGEITDMVETITKIVGISELPMSIVIVGVGGANFEKMVLLDGDEHALQDIYGRTAKRDLVQFVPFRDFASNPALLAEATLAEIPREMLGYFKSLRILPNAPRPPPPVQPYPLAGPAMPFNIAPPTSGGNGPDIAAFGSNSTGSQAPAPVGSAGAIAPPAGGPDIPAFNVPNQAAQPDGNAGLPPGGIPMPTMPQTLPPGGAPPPSVGASESVVTQVVPSVEEAATGDPTNVGVVHEVMQHRRGGASE